MGQKGFRHALPEVAVASSILLEWCEPVSIRGGSEHRSLKLSQFQRLSDPDRYLYVENGSKNHSGSLSERSVQNKQVPIYSTYDTVGERCHVHILDLYIDKMPEKAKQNDWFYVRPLSGTPGSGVWYFASPVGEHTLGGMVKEMFSDIGINDKSNHSLRATGASTLFQSNVPEKIIQERTGHRSLKALRLYERILLQSKMSRFRKFWRLVRPLHL